MEEIIDKILAIDSVIRFVGIIDCKENTLESKMNKNKHSILTPMQEEKFSLSLEKIKDVNQEFNTLLGKTTFMHVMKEKIHLLIFHVGDLMIYISCEPYVGMQKISRLSSKIERIISDTFYIERISKVMYNNSLFS